MSVRSFDAHARRVSVRKGGIGALVALLATVIAVPSGAVSASGGDDDHDRHDDRVVVHEGESIQEAIDAAEPGTKIVVKGDHDENVWIYKNGIELVAAKGASISVPDEPVSNPCEGFDPDTDTVLPTLICIHPIPPTDGPPMGPDYLRNVEVEGFTLNNPIYDAIGAYFTKHLEIEKNTIIDPGCDGIFVIFARYFEIERNVVSGSQFCNGIEVLASYSGRVSRNTANDSRFNGFTINDTYKLVVDRNTASGSCMGISLVDGTDGGYGIRDEEFVAGKTVIKRNTTNGNNEQCQFGPFNVGITGILVAGLHGVTIRDNTANDNTSIRDSVTAGGIVVTDFPNEDGTSNVTTGAVVVRNHATGNSSAAGPVDLNLNTLGELVKVKYNHCDVGFPDATWCSG
jgi:parallel beta-helix repeat protein